MRLLGRRPYEAGQKGRAPGCGDAVGFLGLHRDTDHVPDPGRIVPSQTQLALRLTRSAGSHQDDGLEAVVLGEACEEILSIVGEVRDDLEVGRPLPGQPGRADVDLLDGGREPYLGGTIDPLGPHVLSRAFPGLLVHALSYDAVLCLLCLPVLIPCEKLTMHGAAAR